MKPSLSPQNTLRSPHIVRKSYLLVLTTQPDHTHAHTLTQSASEPLFLTQRGTEHYQPPRVSLCVFVQTCSQLRELVHGPVRAALFPFNWLKMGKQDLSKHTVPITLTHKKLTTPRRTLMKHTYWHTQPQLLLRVLATLLIHQAKWGGCCRPLLSVLSESPCCVMSSPVPLVCFTLLWFTHQRRNVPGTESKTVVFGISM